MDPYFGFCSNTNYTLKDGAVVDEGGWHRARIAIQSTEGPASPERNNQLNAGFTPGADAPEACQAVFTSERSDLSNFACSDSLSKIVTECPYNGGKFTNLCGEWWLMTCPLADDCPVGCPGGEYDVGDSNCGTPW